MDSAPKKEGENQKCSIVLRIQPFFGEMLSVGEDELFMSDAKGKQSAEPFANTTRALFFLLWWVDPLHKFSHITQSQAVPAWWSTLNLTYDESVCP